MTTLAIERPLFHSEADFQHAFAWLLQRQHPAACVRLELPIRTDGVAIHLDVFATFEDCAVAIELKYKTRALTFTVGSEEFILMNHSAQDIGRYDFIKDVQRLEAFVGARTGAVGYAILLTNDSAYWTSGRNPGSVDASFRLA